MKVRAFLIIGIQLFFTAAMAGTELVPIKTDCPRILEGEVLGSEKNAVAVYQAPTEVTTSKDNEFSDLGNLLYNRAANQQDVVVNSRQVKKVTLPKDAFEMLKAFDRHPSIRQGSRIHSLLIETKLDFISSQEGPDPKNPKKTVRLHTFKQELSSELAIFGILVERAGANGNRFDEMIIRFAQNKKGKLNIVDIPLVYQYFGPYQSLDDSLRLADKGLRHNFTVDLNVTDNKGNVILNSGAHAELTTSTMKPTAAGALAVKIYAVKPR